MEKQKKLAQYSLHEPSKLSYIQMLITAILDCLMVCLNRLITMFFVNIFDFLLKSTHYFLLLSFHMFELKKVSSGWIAPPLLLI